MKARIQKPRTRSFSYSRSSRPANRAPKDARTINNSGPQVEIVRPKWTGNGPLTIRPLPMFCAEDPNGPFDPTRLSCDVFDFSDWIRGLPAVKYIGKDQKYTFITHDPRKEEVEGYNPYQDNPYHVLYYAIRDAVQDKGEAIVKGRNVMTSHWAPLVADGLKKAFNAPTKLHYMQAFVYEQDGEVYVRGGQQPKGTNPEDLPIVIEVPKSAGMELAKKLNQLREDYTGDTTPEFQGQMFEYGDIVDLVDGSFVTFYNKDKHYVVEGDVDLDDDQNEFEEEAADTADDREFKGWKVAINKKFVYTGRGSKRYAKVADISEFEDAVRNRLQWWDDILYIPEHEEICMWLAHAFKSMPDILRFGWIDHPEFFTDEVNGVLSNRTLNVGVTEEEEPSEEVVKPKKQTSALLDDVDDIVDELDEEEDAATLAVVLEAEKRASNKTKNMTTEEGLEEEALPEPKIVRRKKKVVKKRRPLSE